MRQLENISLPEEMYARVEECAREHHRSVVDEAAAFVAKAMVAEDVEAALLMDIRQEREKYAKKGVCLTDADMKTGIEWRRK